MAKCRMLLQENEELGKNISSGRTAKLEGEVALEKKFVEEMKTGQAGMIAIRGRLLGNSTNLSGKFCECMARLGLVCRYSYQ